MRSMQSFFPLVKSLFRSRALFSLSSQHTRCAAHVWRAAANHDVQSKRSISCCSETARGRHLLQLGHSSRWFEEKGRVHDGSMLVLWSGRCSPCGTHQAVMSTLWDEIIEPPLHSIDTTFPATRCAKETGWLSDAGPRGLRECELWALLGPNPL